MNGPQTYQLATLGVAATAAAFDWRKGRIPNWLTLGALVAALPFWRGLRRETHAQSAMAGINAAVVGLLAAALYNPAFVSAVLGPRDFAVAAAALALLVAWRAPPLLVAALAAAAGVALAA